MKIRHILLTTDFSPAARLSYPHAMALAEHFGARITLIYVMDLADYTLGHEVATERLQAKLEREIDERLERERERIGTSIEVDATQRIGHPAWEILEYAAFHGVDLIVATRHGHTGLRRLLPGSTTKRLLRHTSTPILVVPADRIETDAPSTGYRHLLSATDFGEDSAMGLREVASLADQMGAEATVVHAYWLPPLMRPMFAEYLSDPGEFSTQAALRVRDRLANELAAFEGRFEPVVEIGSDPASVIVRVADEVGADLIVLPSHGKGPFKAVLVGSTTERVMKTASVPVLIFPRSYLRDVRES